jgi:hypothetical protein
MSERKETVSKPSGEKRERTEEDNTHESQVRNITDPWTRWSLISSLDKDYSQEYLKDGYIIFYLPNRSKYVIEKLYDKNNRPAYGAATYVLDESVFEKNKDEILADGCINRSCLVTLNQEKRQGVKKLVHTGWASALVRYFDIENSKEYTEEEKNDIKEKAEYVEKSKKPRKLL